MQLKRRTRERRTERDRKTTKKRSRFNSGTTSDGNKIVLYPCPFLFTSLRSFLRAYTCGCLLLSSHLPFSYYFSFYARPCACPFISLPLIYFFILLTRTLSLFFACVPFATDNERETRLSEGTASHKSKSSNTIFGTLLAFKDRLSWVKKKENQNLMKRKRE